MIAVDTNILAYAHREDSPFHQAAFRCVATLALLTESAEHWPTLRALLADGRIAGAQVHDARVAALCRQHGVRELWSADRDFSRFSGLAITNPLVGNGSTGHAS